MENIIDFMNPFFSSSESSDKEPPSKTPPLPENPAVTMAYVPMQESAKVYDEEEALSKGTLFPVLDKPFYGKEGLDK